MPKPQRVSGPKQLLFAAIIVVGFFVLVEALLWMGGIRPAAESADPYVGFSSSRPLFVETHDPAFLTTAPYKLSWFNRQSFHRRKPPGVYRVFTLGGSTTYGRPYTDPLSFSGWLRELLPLADPSREWEVINAGGISYASYRVSLVLEELLAYEPDLLVIYTGHNEFLERRTYPRLSQTPHLLTTLGDWASRTRLYSALQRTILPASEEKTILAGEVDTILQHATGPQDYRRDDGLREQVFAHFQLNLERMITMARSAGAEVVLITPVSNWKDCSPFKSQRRDGLDPESAEAFDALLRRAISSDASVDLLYRARDIDDRYAEVHYRLGQALYQFGRYEEAGAALSRAVEEDVCPLRAPARISEIVATVAQRESIPLVDFAATLRGLSPHGIPGSEHFLDHVHLNAKSYGLLAREIVETLAREGRLRASSSWDEERIAQAGDRVLARLDRQAHGESLRNLSKVFDWAGKFAEAERLARQAAEALGDDAESYGVLGHAALARGDRDAAVRYLTEAVRIRPNYADAHFDLGTALHGEGRYEEAVRHFHIALEAGSDSSDTRYNLGLSLHALGLTGSAIDEFRAALDANPNHADALSNLGALLLTQGQADAAIDVFRRAVALEPNSAESHFSLGAALEARGEIEEAMAEFRQAIRLDAAWDLPLQRLAWLLATSRDERIRDGALAVRLAERAAEQTGRQDPGVLDILAASLADAGRFTDAIEAARRALHLYEAAGAGESADDLRQRLELYRKRRPYRMP